MITTATRPSPPLAPTNDPTPVIDALVSSISAGHPPETFLWINIHKPCGGVRTRYAWTDGGTELGDRIDALALSLGLDAADWMHISTENAQTSTRGRVRILAHSLRPILSDVQNDVRCPTSRRDGLHRMLAIAAEHSGTTAYGMPRWVGVGPTLLNRSA